MRERRVPERFGSHLDMVTSIAYSEATFDEKVAYLLTEALPRGKYVHFKDKFAGVSDTFLGKRKCGDLGTKESGPLVFVSL
jgi:hypothetical protein